MSDDERRTPCGPHCGIKDRIEACCNGCHARLAHGNAWWSRGLDGGAGRWQVRSFAADGGSAA